MNTASAKITDEQLKTALKRFFGFDDFLDHQKEVVQAVVSGKDYCVIMPTGAGKSLCYQLPVLLNDGYGIVVSPLIALMKDQIDSLRSRSIPAAAVNSTITPAEQYSILRQVAAGNIKILYVAPERFSAENFMSFVQNNPPSMLVVDEAHCISQWGHDFRPSYSQLGVIAQKLNIPQVCAFTATATPRVREDIKEQLRRPDMQYCVAGFKRPNLSFKVLECRGNEEKLAAVKELLAQPCNGAVIIYAATRKQVDELTGALNILGYHAGMTDEERTAVQNEFMTQPHPVLAATNAFGMGIDRSDVRRVIHYNITSSLEAYYQEAGRAGRDGEPSECILLFSYGDRYVQEFLIDMSNPPPDLLKRLYQYLVMQSEKNPDADLEFAPRDLAAMLDARNDSQIYSALRVLEHYQKLTRTGRSDSTGTLQLRGNATLLEQMHASEKNQRSRFIHRVLSEYGLSSFQTTFHDLAALTGLNYDQLRRVMNYLNGDTLAWQPAPGSGLLRLTDLNEKVLNMDFSALERKRAFESGKLEDVIVYAQTRSCRQAALIGYFGENSQSWQCRCCDNCDRTLQLQGRMHELSPDELDGVVSILECVRRFNGRFGRGKLSLILCGARRTEILNLNVQHSSHFGVLRGWKQEQVLDYLRALEKAGFLRATDSEYPCIMLTCAGEDFIDSPENISLELRNAPEKVSVSRAAGRKKSSSVRRSGETVFSAPADGKSAAGDRRLLERAGLREELRALRKEKAGEMQVKVFQIFSDAVLDELILRMPISTEECARIKGISPQKAEQLMSDFIELIKRYRRENLLGS